MEPSRPLAAAARTRMPTLPDLSRARYGPGHAAVEVAGAPASDRRYLPTGFQ